MPGAGSPARRRRLRRAASLALLPAALAVPAAAAGVQAAGPDLAPGAYEVYVANESSDVVSRVAFEPGRGARIVGDVPVGVLPGEIDGAHGVTVAPDGSAVYVTLAHGNPYGAVWRLEGGADTVTARTRLGLFPSTMGITPDGTLLLVANFNLHGDPVPSEVSVVHTPGMLEVTRVRTCVMPHGSRVNPSGTRHYSVCMHSDQLVEIDLGALRLSRRFSVAPGAEGTLPVDDGGEGHAGTAEEGGAGGPAAAAGHGAHAAACSPTWAEPGEGPRADRWVYVACNGRGEVLEVDVERWEVTRRFATGPGPYNLEATADGRWLLATLKGGQALAVLDLESGEEVARVAATRPVTHGVVASPDSRYAFVTNEAVGGTRGTLDVIDLGTFERVASVELHHQPGGIDFRWGGRSSPAPGG